MTAPLTTARPAALLERSLAATADREALIETCARLPFPAWKRLLADSWSHVWNAVFDGGDVDLVVEIGRRRVDRQRRRLGLPPLQREAVAARPPWTPLSPDLEIRSINLRLLREQGVVGPRGCLFGGYAGAGSA